MGVFKWLRRERVTVTTQHDVSTSPTTTEDSNSIDQSAKIRTEEYKRDLAEFQARRSAGSKELQTTPDKKTCGRHSLPVSCTKCSADHDNTFSYEKKSALKYKKKQQKRSKSSSPEKDCEGVPNIQFLFQNQVFMPGNLFPNPSFSEPQKSKRKSQHVCRSPNLDFLVQKHIDFREDEQVNSPPEFYKNSSLPYDVMDFVDTSRINEEDVDGPKAACDVRSSSQTSQNEGKDDSGDDKLWEVMSELKHFDQWADEQLQPRSANTTKSEDTKSEASTYGLPIASARNLDVSLDKSRLWNNGKWGLVPVQIKKLVGVTAEHVKKKRNTEINILRKCRHPNIVLLMGLYPDAHNNMHIICERCVDSLFGIIHIQGRIMSAQTSVQYALDIANALVFLRMQGYVHTRLNSTSIMVTSHDAAKLADVGSCTKLPIIDEERKVEKKGYEVYTDEPKYVNIEGTREPRTGDCDPLISQNSSEVYLSTNAVAKPYHIYKNSEMYQWQAPELYMPNEDSLVYACSRSDVYSLSVVLWECCNASIPWKNLSYDKLQEQYTSRKSGIPLPQDGTYPGCLLSLLQSGLKLERNDRMDLHSLQKNLQTVKNSLDDLGYIIIPARLPFKKITTNSSTWDTTDSECLSPKNVKAVVHKTSRKPADSSTESSDKDCSKSDVTPVYEALRNTYVDTKYSVPQTCFLSNESDVEQRPVINYEKLPEKDYSSACSTPIAKLKARIKDLETPGTLHRSDSTEYCSILSPNRTTNFGSNDDSHKDQSSVERPTTKLSRSFTPKSYKPLHIKVPDYNLDSIRPLIKSQNSTEHPTYNFDIKNYSLPTTPIARSNKLRKNAWLSGELSASDKSSEQRTDISPKSLDKELPVKNTQSTSDTPAISVYSTTDDPVTSESNSPKQDKIDDQADKTTDLCRDSYTGLRIINHPQDFLSSETGDKLERRNSCPKPCTGRVTNKYGVEEDVLANINVRPLVAIHERWIYEANKKTARSMSLPDDNRSQVPAVKPASHCVDTFQKSLPQLNPKKTTKVFRTRPISPSICVKNVGPWNQFCQARDSVAKNFQHSARETDGYYGCRRDSDDKSCDSKNEVKIDQATDTQSIEEYIRSLIRKEFQHLIQDLPDDSSTVSTVQKNDDLLNKGVANIINSLHTTEEEKCTKKDTVKSFSRVKINGNNKPLLQITFSRSGENSLQVLDNCVNVTLSEGNAGREKLNVSVEETLNEDIHINSLKRCQAFNAIQEARSTEDLYIDDDLSTQLQENFGGKVKLIPLHGSLHEILCEKEDDCCLIKVKQENGCDTIYFRCDNSDTESRDRDAIDGVPRDPPHSRDPPHTRDPPYTRDPRGARDTVVFKRSISLIEERIQRFVPKDKRTPTPVLQRKVKTNETKVRPKSEIFVPITKETRVLSNSSPSLVIKDDREVEVNIENAMCYQDSSSDECLRCSDSDDFELLERKIEEDIANNTTSSLTCGCLEKISEENLSVLNEEIADRD